MRAGKARPWVALVLVAGIIALAASHSFATRDAARIAVTLWWNHLVPVLLPGYVLAWSVISMMPRPTLLWLALLAICTMPPVVAMVLWDWSRTRSIPAQQLVPFLLYTNLYNPLFFPNPRLGLWLDVAALGSALVLWPPGRWARLSMPKQTPAPRTWILDGMNWTSIVGFLTVTAWIGHAWLAPIKVGWLVDPISFLWGGARTRVWEPWALFWVVLGGLGFWGPFFLGLGQNRDRMRASLLRLAQAALSALLVSLAGQFLHL